MKKWIKKISLLSLIALLMAGCMSKEEKMKKAEEEGNEAVGLKAKFIEGAGNALQKEGKDAAESASKGVGEVVKGVNSGITESLSEAPVILEPEFAANFDECRAEKIYASETDKTKKVSIYLIAKNDFKGKIILKALDKNKKEIGRSSMNVSISKDDAKYVDFVFDPRTPLMKAEYFSIK